MPIIENFAKPSVLVVNKKKILEKRELIRFRPYGGGTTLSGLFIVEGGLSSEDWIVHDASEHLLDVGLVVQSQEVPLSPESPFLDKPDAETPKPVDVKSETK